MRRTHPFWQSVAILALVVASGWAMADYILPRPRPMPRASPSAAPPMQGMFTPRQVTTEGIEMTGQRWPGRTVTSDEITMTGRRSPPVAVDTLEIHMTGRR